jgi:hypothetical protein
MDRERVDAWLEGHRRAWAQTDTAAAAELFTEDASYRSHDQEDIRVRFAEPIVDDALKGWDEHAPSTGSVGDGCGTNAAAQGDRFS